MFVVVSGALGELIGGLECQRFLLVRRIFGLTIIQMPRIFFLLFCQRRFAVIFGLEAWDDERGSLAERVAGGWWCNGQRRLRLWCGRRSYARSGRNRCDRV